MDSPKEREEPLAFALSSHWKTKTRANFMAERFQVRDNGELTGGPFFAERGPWEMGTRVSFSPHTVIASSPLSTSRNRKTCW